MASLKHNKKQLFLGGLGLAGGSAEKNLYIFLKYICCFWLKDPSFLAFALYPSNAAVKHFSIKCISASYSEQEQDSKKHIGEQK